MQKELRPLGGSPETRPGTAASCFYALQRQEQQLQGAAAKADIDLVAVVRTDQRDRNETDGNCADEYTQEAASAMPDVRKTLE